MINPLFYAILCVCFISLGGMGCGPKKEQTEGEESGKPLLVGTATMVVDLLKEIGGEEFEIVGLMDPGVDPHSYQPRGFSDMNKMEKAKGVFYIGLHLEGNMQQSLEGLAKRRAHVVALSDLVNQEDLLVPEEAFEGHYDPHIWGDPRLWKQTVDGVVQELAVLMPEKEAFFKENGRAYKERLDELWRWAESRVQEIPKEQRVLVTSHDAFFYFGRAFEFEVRGLQGLSTISEIGLKDRKELVEFIKGRQVKTIFPESSVNPKAVQAIAQEAGVERSSESLYSDALGQPGDRVTVRGESYDRGTYIGMVKHNINTIVHGLKK